MIRACIFWESIEPTRGCYNDDYIRDLRDFIKAAFDHGFPPPHPHQPPSLITLVDFHQDLYSRRLGGSGFPDWALPPDVAAMVSSRSIRFRGKGYDHVRPATGAAGGGGVTSQGGGRGGTCHRPNNKSAGATFGRGGMCAARTSR
jgi:hypothetical protein